MSHAVVTTAVMHQALAAACHMRLGVAGLKAVASCSNGPANKGAPPSTARYLGLSLWRNYLLCLRLAGHLHRSPARLAPPLQHCAPEADQLRRQLLWPGRSAADAGREAAC